MKFSLFFAAVASAPAAAAHAAGNPERINEFVILEGHTKMDHVVSPLPHT